MDTVLFGLNSESFCRAAYDLLTLATSCRSVHQQNRTYLERSNIVFCLVFACEYAYFSRADLPAIQQSTNFL